MHIKEMRHKVMEGIRASEGGLLQSINFVNFIVNLWRKAWHPLQYSCLENPTDRGAWWATVHRVIELDTTEATQHACMHSKSDYRFEEY